MRITDKDLEAVCLRINRTLNRPETTWTKTETGPRANIGNFHLSGAYGGVALHCICSDGGGVNDIFGGHMPKRDLYNRMQAYLKGLCEYLL